MWLSADDHRRLFGHVGALQFSAAGPKSAYVGPAGMFTHDPGVLYAAALGNVIGTATIDRGAAINAELSIVSKYVLQEGERLLTTLLGEVSTKIGDAILSGIAEAVGWNTIDAVAGVAGEIASAAAAVVPFVNMVLSVVGAAQDSINAYQLQWKQHQIDNAHDILIRAPLGSGYNGLILPADIFAYEPDWLPESGVSVPQIHQGYPYMPATALGIVLAAITEDSSSDWAPRMPYAYGVNPPDAQNGNPPGVVTDSNLHHSAWYWDNARASSPRALRPGQNFVNAISPDRRRTYQLLRRAMGSRNKDQGVSLWPIYMDMLLADVRSGAIDPPASLGQLTNVFCDSTIDGTFAMTPDEQALMSTDPASIQGNVLMNLVRVAVPWSPGQMTPFVDQITNLVNDWETRRNDFNPPKLIHFGSVADAKRRLGAATNPNVRTPLSPFIAGGLALVAARLLGWL